MSTNFDVMMARLRASDSPFLAEVADEISRMDSIIARLECDFVELHDRNTRSAQTISEIEQTIASVRTLDLNPITAINRIDDLVQAINEEAKQ